MTQTPDRCTCCAVHGQGVHRSITSTPLSDIPAPASLRQAERSFAAAVAAEGKARDTWSAAAIRAAAFEESLRGRYEQTMRGIESATRKERRELADLQSHAKGLFERFQEAARVTVEARQVHAREAHLATQALISTWRDQ